ncbi:P-loop NTPase fold protein [Vibrio vulnificus]|uniref:P-loop NTPase fold protein n=1 Tax=Vibrio vulnificus TaxID=672 RepID=UPI001A1E6A71|nr:AAA family ATPase [Vibrio vulnificus]HAS6035747.1 AAA family ATPase [Vibrio vulnificus]HDY7428841.1 AAA family ATPase [Vibrio vulnificus]HDY7951471.1 AAA family ATPase [Vibrio vulnificus]
MGTSRNYQNEKPVDSDLFSGQGHKQVADAIAKVLYSDSNQHIIGIEGNLGAGKSSVINILKNEIETSGFHIVTFDADQYHKNLKPALIRTIEAELKQLLGNNSPTQHEELKSAVEKALGQRLEYTKITNSHITPPAIAFGFTLAVAALQLRPALTFLAELASSKEGVNVLAGIVACALLALPFLTWLVIKNGPSKLSLGDLVKRNSKDTISETIDINREVGAIELREAFTTFANLIPTGTVIVLVVDNIDRVAPDIARELWSDIEILTSLGSERFRILLPYSEEHLAKALEKSAVDESQSGREFISKRIPVPFSAPPIVTAGWRAQFDAYWAETLPDICGKEGVKSLVDIWGNKVTPRYLKSLVNRIGAKIDSCPEGNELLNGACCAAYILAVKDNSIPINDLLSDPTKLVSKSEIDESFRDTIRKLTGTHRVLKKHSGERHDWAKQVAALHYQTSFEIAESELIAEPIRVAFDTHKTTTLLELKPLLGFDVFFRQQIEQTDPIELVKVAATLVEEVEGRELVNEYLHDINHELKEISKEKADSFDADLVSSYNSLLQSKININLTPIEIRQKVSTTKIRTIWQALDQLDSPTFSGTPYSLEDLHSIIKENHAYSKITHKTPRIVSKATASFAVNALYPIADQLDQWNIESLIENAGYEKVVQSACFRRERVQNELTIFPLLLTKCKVGLLQKLDVSTLLHFAKITDFGADIETIPFTKDWQDSGNGKKNLAKRLGLELSNADHEGTLDNASMAKLSACTIAAVINAYIPSEWDSFRDHHSRNDTSIEAKQWLIGIINRYPACIDFIADYLSAAPWRQIMAWCTPQETLKHIPPHLEILIKNDRICHASVSTLTGGDYTVISNTKQTLTNEELVEWVGGLLLDIKVNSPEQWSKDLIDDVIHYEQPQLLGLLLDYVDNDKLTQSDWLMRLKQVDTVTKQIIDHMIDKGKTLKHAQQLVNSLQDIPKTEEIYDKEHVNRLATLLSPSHKLSITRAWSRNLFKENIPHRYRSINYFGNEMKMPDLKDSEMRQDAIHFIDEAVNKDKEQETIAWLVNQPTHGSGWCIEAWPTKELNELYDVIENSDCEPLLSAIRERRQEDQNGALQAVVEQ